MKQIDHIGEKNEAGFIDSLIKKVLDKLSLTGILIIAFSCAVCAEILSVVIEKYCFLSFLSFLVVLANFVATFISVLGILSIQKEMEEDNRKESLWQTEKELPKPTDVFIDAAKEDAKIVEDVKNEVKGISKESSDLQDNISDSAGEFYSLLKDRLKKCMVVFVVYNNTPESWLKARINLYRRLKVLNKVIVLTTNERSKQNALSIKGIEVRTALDEKGQLDQKQLFSSSRIPAEYRRQPVS